MIGQGDFAETYLLRGLRLLSRTQADASASSHASSRSLLVKFDPFSLGAFLELRSLMLADDHEKSLSQGS